jgi:prephenate dehydrogenase
MSDVAILGTGLIGGSVGLALRRQDPEARIVGYDGNPGAAERAVERGAITERSSDPREAVRGAELVILALPVDRIAEALDQIRKSVLPSAVVTDVGSAKVDVVAAGEDAFDGRFVGGHPMAGSEQGGIEAADASLFDGARWILTPTARTDHASYMQVVGLVGSLGAKVVAIDAATHDALLARISHVPQVVAGAVVAAAASGGDQPAHLALAANGFRDVTRIASSPPDLWVAILRSNTQAVVQGLAAVRERLAEVSGMIEEGRWEELEGWLSSARSNRAEMFAKPGPSPESASLVMLVPDRPGVLAEVTTAAGRMGANIEDLRIVHSPEGGRGRLELSIAGDPYETGLVGALEALGYHVLPGD